MDILEKAKNYIKEITKSKELYNIFASDNFYKPFDVPSTFFMAGSPGAGKTEISKNFIKNMRENEDFSIVRIDADEIREMCPGYTGDNAHLFQEAATLGVNKLYDYVNKKKFNVLIDSTFSNFEYAKSNIYRAINKRRLVDIFYIYQDPIKAWEFTLKREIIQKRKITIDIFVEDFFLAKENVNKVKKIFKEEINVNLIIKDYNYDIKKFNMNIQDIDNYIKFEYDKKSLYNDLKKIKL